MMVVYLTDYYHNSFNVNPDLQFKLELLTNGIIYKESRNLSINLSITSAKLMNSLSALQNFSNIDKSFIVYHALKLVSFINDVIHFPIISWNNIAIRHIISHKNCYHKNSSLGKNRANGELKLPIVKVKINIFLFDFFLRLVRVVGFLYYFSK